MSQPEGGSHPAYEGFGGRVGRTFRSSEPWWPPRVEAPEGAPNVVVVLVDDLGYSDLGCYGSEIRTPNIDALAARGVRYANFHVTPLCSPTRAALLTGLNSHAAGVGFVSNVDPGFPGYVSELPRNQPTLAEIFRDNGYSTLMLGKWHLSKDSDISEAGDHGSWPLQRGFDEFYGFLDPMTNLHQPHRLLDGNSVVHVDEYPEGYYLTDDLTDRAVRMIKGVKAANPRKPFFMYFAHGAVHAPLLAKREDIERYRGRYNGGWDRLREERLARQVELGLVAPGTRLPARNAEQHEDVEAWDDLPDELKPLFARYMEVYAGMVDNVDQSVGRLVECLAALGELDNTVFLLTSDNGASREGNAQGGSHYRRGQTAEPGKTVQTADILAKDLAVLDDIGGPSTWPHYPRGWAMACNTPFRLYKTTTFRGGHQVPLVVSWPQRIPDGGAIVKRQYAHVTDVLPTLVDLIGLTVPAERDGRPAEPVHGVSFAPMLEDPDAPSAHTEQYYECVGNRAFYQDGWEAITYRIPSTPFSEERWQLYDVTTDPTQIDDLAAQHPERVEELAQRWEEAAWANRVFPLYEGDGIHALIRPGWEAVLSAPVRFLPGTPTLDRYRSSQLIAGRSFQLAVDWAYRPGDEGVLFAHGGVEAGYVLYVEDGALQFLLNASGDLFPLPAMPLAGPSAASSWTSPRRAAASGTCGSRLTGRSSARPRGCRSSLASFPSRAWTSASTGGRPCRGSSSSATGASPSPASSAPWSTRPASRLPTPPRCSWPRPAPWAPPSSSAGGRRQRDDQLAKEPPRGT